MSCGKARFAESWGMPDSTQKPKTASPGTSQGVWIIVGMTCVFALLAFGIAAVIVVKEVSKHKMASTQVSTDTQKAVALRGTPASGTAVGIKNAAPIATSVPTAEDQERQSMRAEVLKRIDVMQGITQKEKDTLYAQVERARGFTKAAVISFPTGRTSPADKDIHELIQVLQRSEQRKWLDDPTVALVVAGYADTQGDPTKNLTVSRTRAENVMKAIKDRLHLTNVIHAVGMGGQDLFDKNHLDKNRLAEVWVVLP
jgi:outer membrane protein OmpA-like peptidoglycan-associated protein